MSHCLIIFAAGDRPHAKAGHRPHSGACEHSTPGVLDAARPPDMFARDWVGEESQEIIEIPQLDRAQD
jgi:hypothetical protein